MFQSRDALKFKDVAFINIWKETSQELLTVTYSVTREPMTHFKIEVRSLCKGVSKILTAYRI